MKNIKKIGLYAIVLLICCLFTSCVDYVQSVSIDGDNVVTNYKVTTSKLLLEQTDEDGSDIYKEFENIKDSLPGETTVNYVDNDVDYGIEFEYSINLNTDDEFESAFLPLYDSENDLYYFPFILGNNTEEFEDLLYSEGDQEMQAIMLLYLSTAKCRYIISKEIIPNLEGAFFDGVNTEAELPVYDYGDSYGIEIPLITLAMGKGETLDMSYIVVY